ncbi:hypothetical protein HELRODRAFT_158659 [Helobdella robusta]|uniref:pseudouridine 5'-phosphatase n=1 Tax=Helobdella robusta TaxID=6412 RepID=T1EN36_HELRO|nr:hypothetical protein HELRODRAFT_158659 [Helobdella robusta]ESO12195.1 hypothetical protein HELRODRAFT_158659 [Helobdella robusta]
MSGLNITHVIFDVDGVLLDTEHLYTEMLQSFASEFRKTFTINIKLKQMGRSNVEAAQIFIKELEIPITTDEYIQKMACLQKEYFPNVKLIPGVERIVEHLHKNNIPMAIATGSCQESFDTKTSKHKNFFNKYFSHVVLGSDPDLLYGKPAPDIYIKAAKMFVKPPKNPENVLIFEDAINGVQAGVAANMNVVWIPDLAITPADKIDIKQGSIFQLNSLNDFKPELFGLPVY